MIATRSLMAELLAGKAARLWGSWAGHEVFAAFRGDYPWNKHIKFEWLEDQQYGRVFNRLEELCGAQDGAYI